MTSLTLTYPYLPELIRLRYGISRFYVVFSALRFRLNKDGTGRILVCIPSLFRVFVSSLKLRETV